MNAVTVTGGAAAPSSLPARNRDDYEFLPAALEILETPLSPLRRGVGVTICGFAVAALGLSYFGHVDVIAAAQGKVQAVGRTKTVQPLEGGRVQRIAIENGSTVKAGDILLELDPAEALADEAMLASDLRALKAEALRRRAVLQAVTDGTASPSMAWDPGTPPAVVERETRVLTNDLGQLASQVASLDAREQQSAAEATRLQATIAAQEALVATLRQRVDMRSELLARNAESKASVIDAQEVWQTQTAALAAQKGQRGESDAARLLAQRDIVHAYAVFRAENSQKLAEAERRIDDDAEKLAKARLRISHMQLRSPADGRVQGLSVTSLGQVLTSGEQVMQVVPIGAQLEVEAYIGNADAGFIGPGQAAVVKVQSFPFTTYGTLDARVTRIAADAIPLAEAEAREGNPTLGARGDSFGGAQRLQNLVFPATLLLESAKVQGDGKDHPLSPGMAVTVEIKTGSRRILDYLAGPLIEAAGTALRER